MLTRRRTNLARAAARPRAKRSTPFSASLALICIVFACQRSSAADERERPLTVSTPVALAQTGLNGTFMSLGCEYAFQQGTRNPKARYVAIVKNGKGKTVAVPVNLDEHGMAAIFIDGWRPGDQPFSGYFAEHANAGSKGAKPEYRAISTDIEFPLDPNQQ